MSVRSMLATAVIACIAMSNGHAEEFVAEQLTVEPHIKPGANVFVLDQSWTGASQINVLGIEDLSRKGNLSLGLNSQMVVSPDFKTVYTTSIYARRITHGPLEVVLQEFDVDTLTLRREIPILERTAQVAPNIAALQLSADRQYAFVQNATPATSVSVVDLTAGKHLAEVPTPGCWGAFAGKADIKFTTLCGSGKLVSYSLDANGEYEAHPASEKIFDTDRKPLYTHALRAGDDLIFSSFDGSLFRVSDAGDTPRLVDSFSYVEGVDGNWAPGGVAMMTYSPEHNVLFIAMHANARNGSHKDNAQEIWAVDLGSKKLLSRSPVKDILSLTVSADASVLFGLSDEDHSLTRYSVDRRDGFRLTANGKVAELGGFTVSAVVGN